MNPEKSLTYPLANSLLIFAGPLGGVIAFMVLSHFFPEAPVTARLAGFVTAWMAVWWMTEAVPIEATALLPIVLMPLLGIEKIGPTTAKYADPNVFLYLGGIGVAFGIEKTGLHRRGALAVLRVVGTSPRAIVGGFMLVTAALSMWISNTATAILMLPLARSVIRITSEDDSAAEKAGANSLACSLLLGIAYAASIGGMGTFVGTPTNIIFRDFMKRQETPISFFGWMQIAMPIVVVMLFTAWILLTAVFFRKASSSRLSRDWVVEEQESLPKWTTAEFWALAVFCFAAISWTFRELLSTTPFIATNFPWILGISDTTIAVAGLIALLAIPVPHSSSEGSNQKLLRPVLNWDDIQRAPWGVLLLLGGGLSLAEAIQTSGLANVIASSAQHLQHVPTALLILIVVTSVVLVSELASNVATAATMLPILAGVAQGLNIPPEVFAVPAILAASCGFMLPVATPPNAVVFGERKLTMRQMMQVGLFLDLACIAIIWLMTLFGIHL